MKTDPLSVGVEVPPVKVVQSASVGNTAKPRQKKPREIQSLKKVMTTHLAKLDAGLR